MRDDDKDGVVRFRHQNGRTFFCEQYRPRSGKGYVISEKMSESLSGKTVERQMDYFSVAESIKFYSTSYGEIDRERLRERAVPLRDYEGVRKLLLKGEILIGAKIETRWGEEVLLPERPVCTYRASDNEGSGTKEREDYAYLFFSDPGLSSR